MKYIKNLIRIIIIIIIIILLNYIRLYTNYILNKHKYINTYKIQGNTNNYVPQAITYSSKYNIIIQTSYNYKKKTSKIYLTDYKTNKLIKELYLKYENGKNNTNHVGGITTNNNIVWITNDYLVSEYKLDNIINTNKNYIKSYKTSKIPIRGDFCNYKDNKLWIGEFYLKYFYDSEEKTPLLMEYNSNNIDYNNPKLIIELPSMVQGMTITDNNEFVFTKSFSSVINSELSFYKIKFNNKKKHYKLNNKNLIRKEKLPPMAEGLFYKDNYLYILFENSSNRYYYAFPKLKYIIKYKV